MTHQLDTELLTTVMQLLTKEGSSGFAEGLRLLVNEAMVAERTAVLGARPYERSEARLGHANGFKPKTLATRLGAIEFRVPQVRGEVDFYPSSLEKGVRSEQALKLALLANVCSGSLHPQGECHCGGTLRPFGEFDPGEPVCRQIGYRVLLMAQSAL